jgi:uncharacterized protein DUF429
MLFPDAVYVGVDPASGRKGLAYAALDRGLGLLALAEGEIEDLTAFLGAQKSAVVAINAPSSANCGSVRRMLEKQSLAPGMHQIRGADIRMAEYELRERGIMVTGTPGRREACPGWMQAGFDLFARLRKLGFEQFGESEASYRLMETHPHACFCVLLEQSPLPKPTLEGRLQRQLVLHERGVGVRDAMEFFEEITRFRLMKGILPVDMVQTPEMLDVLAAALTAWMAVHQAEQVTRVGDAEEGLVTLPGALKARY